MVTNPEDKFSGDEVYLSSMIKTRMTFKRLCPNYCKEVNIEIIKKVSEYEYEMPQSHTTDKPMAQ